MKKSIQITVEKNVLLRARAKALKKETVISHIIEDFLRLWVDGNLQDQGTLREIVEES